MKTIRLPAYVAARINRKHSDFKIDTFCAGGKGGMNQNKVASAVRITDKITGISAECREERDQPQNKKRAFYKLVDRMIAYYMKQRKAIPSVSTEKIRSYNEKLNQVIDHRTGCRQTYQTTLNGELDPFVEAMLIEGAKNVE